jgi:hypothetical protein
MMTAPQLQAGPATAKESFVARLLDPVTRLVEAMYSVLIVLTFTLAYRTLEANSPLGQQAATVLVNQLFWAALGCAVAWGLIDGVMYVLSAMFERGHQRRLIMTVSAAADTQEGISLLSDELDGDLADFTTADARTVLYESIYNRLRATPPQTVGFKREDFAGALGVALVAIGAALPVVLPLLLSQSSPVLAIRLSNLVAFVMLFALGYRWGRHTGAVPWKIGLLLLAIGVAMMAVAIPLGG